MSDAQKECEDQRNVSERVKRGLTGVGFCPNCGGSVVLSAWQNADESKYCFRCGQKISWLGQIKEFVFKWEYGWWNRCGYGIEPDGSWVTIVDTDDSLEDGDRIIAQQCNRDGSWDQWEFIRKIQDV